MGWGWHIFDNGSSRMEKKVRSSRSVMGKGWFWELIESYSQLRRIQTCHYCVVDKQDMPRSGRIMHVEREPAAGSCSHAGQMWRAGCHVRPQAHNRVRFLRRVRTSEKLVGNTRASEEHADVGLVEKIPKHGAGPSFVAGLRHSGGASKGHEEKPGSQTPASLPTPSHARHQRHQRSAHSQERPSPRWPTPHLLRPLSTGGVTALLTAHSLSAVIPVYRMSFPGAGSSSSSSTPVSDFPRARICTTHLPSCSPGTNHILI